MSTVISRDKYAKLLAKRLPRVIENDAQHQQLLAAIRDLMAAGNHMTPEEEELLKLLVLLVETYESKRFIEANTSVLPLEMLKHLMEAHGHTAKDLWDIVGDKGTVSKILSGERGISKTHAKSLADFYHVSVSTLI